MKNAEWEQQATKLLEELKKTDSRDAEQLMISAREREDALALKAEAEHTVVKAREGKQYWNAQYIKTLDELASLRSDRLALAERVREGCAKSLIRKIDANVIRTLDLAPFLEEKSAPTLPIPPSATGLTPAARPGAESRAFTDVVKVKDR